MNKYISIAIIALLFLSFGKKPQPTIYKTIGTIERYDSKLDKIISSNAKVEIISEGYQWSEGSLWIEKYKMLLFSDVPANTVYQWTEKEGTKVYLKPSGYTGTTPSKSREPGSNGLTLDNNGNLVLCQHGNRQVARMNAPLDKPNSQFTSLINAYKGKKLSSPNDCVFNKKGELFITDPPYGLPTQSDTDPSKEIKFNGVYKVKKEGSVILLTDSINRPNGIALFPDEKRILVANSDPEKPNWYVWDINGDHLTNGEVFHSTIGYDKTWKGLPDGLKIDKNGNVFATGPGGLYIFDKEGKKLGMIRLDNPTSNCTLSQDQKTLYITNNSYVLRVKMR